MAETPIPNLSPQLRWLADAPLFIDAEQVGRFHDAVVQPESEAVSTKIELSEQVVKDMGGKLGLTAEVEPNKLFQTLTNIFPFLNLKGKAHAEGTTRYETGEGDTRTMEFRPIRTPQRQLVHLTLHYLVQLPMRIEFVEKLADSRWRSEEFIHETPRAMAFIELPPKTVILPTAAEFDDGVVELIYETFEESIKTSSDQSLVEYPREPEPEALKMYWQQFTESYSATQAMLAIEKASKKHKGEKIRWIDFRVPLTDAGDTLHLHFSPNGGYATGVFAYNFVKRGYKHGARLVGTLKSEPDMNVLAIYER